MSVTGNETVSTAITEPSMAAGTGILNSDRIVGATSVFDTRPRRCVVAEVRTP